MVTVKELKNLDTKYIYSIKKRVGLLAELTEAKYFKSSFSNTYVIATREGILNYFGDAQKAQIYGTKGKHYKEYKTASGAAKYINSLS